MVLSHNSLCSQEPEVELGGYELAHKRSLQREEELEPLFPEGLFATRVSGRSVSFDWATLNPTEEQKKNQKKVLYQLSRSDPRKEGIFFVVYEGDKSHHEAINLIPQTEYKFKLRLSFDDGKIPHRK